MKQCYFTSNSADNNSNQEIRPEEYIEHSFLSGKIGILVNDVISNFWKEVDGKDIKNNGIQERQEKQALVSCNQAYPVIAYPSEIHCQQKHKNGESEMAQVGYNVSDFYVEFIMKLIAPMKIINSHKQRRFPLQLAVTDIFNASETNADYRPTVQSFQNCSRRH